MSDMPSDQPSSHPSSQPSIQPSAYPSYQPSGYASYQPSGYPSYQPSAYPSYQPSAYPSAYPSYQPSAYPSYQPSYQPSAYASYQPSQYPSYQPSGYPSYQPSAYASFQPSGQPAYQPVPVQLPGQPGAQPASSGASKLQPGETVTVGGHQYVIYASEVRQGGTLAWKNHNPGNIRPKGSSLLFGAIGINHTGSNGDFLIFPDDTTGYDAIIQNLHAYGHLTLFDAISRWAPASDHNDPSAYANQVAKHMKVSSSAYIDTFDDSQFHQMADAIKQVEGTTPGTTYSHTDPNLPKEVRDRL